MKLNELEISQETFFKVGVWSFLIIGVANIFNYFLNLSSQNVFSTISSWASIVFNFALVLFFRYLQKQTSPEISEEYASDDVADIIKQVKSKK